MSAPRLLFVDDDVPTTQIVARVGVTCGFDVQAVHVGADFRTAYKSFAPDLVVLDLAMPGDDGIDLLRFLADESCTSPIMVMSGYDSRVLSAAERLGCERGLQIAAAVPKPLSVTELKALFTSMHTRISQQVGTTG